MKHWRNIQKIEDSENDIEKSNLVDVYKKEILDTRVIVSKLLEKSRLINFPNLRREKDNSKVCENAC